MSYAKQNDCYKAIDFIHQGYKVTKDILKDILNDYLGGKTKRRGKVRYGKLAKAGKLDNIEITENNIRDFRNVAEKYDVDYALKRDSSTDPPTYHVFFTASNSDTLNRAFKEYAQGVTNEKIKENPISSREQLNRSAKIISNKSKDKEKHLSQGEHSR